MRRSMSVTISHLLARFEDAKHARQCFIALRRRQLFRPELHVAVQHERKGHEELPLGFTHARAGVIQGAILGGLAGLVTGVIVAVGEGRTLGSAPVFAALFALFGLLMGGFAGALLGPMNPKPSLERAEEDGALLLLIESTENNDIEWAKRTVAKAGGVVVEAPGQPALAS